MVARGGGGGAGRPMPKLSHFYSHLSLLKALCTGGSILQIAALVAVA